MNLRQLFGRRYRVTYEESYYAQYGPMARVEDPAYQTIRCRYGHIYPWAGTTLAVSVDGYRKVAGVIKRLPCCRVVQDGDFGELTATFDVADFDQVAEVIQPRRRRQLSPEARQAAGERLRQFRFRPAVEMQLAGRRREEIAPLDSQDLPPENSRSAAWGSN